MTNKEKITEILKAYTKKHNISASSVILEEYAEELVANGAIVPPCKVGDKVYYFVDINIPQRLMLESRIYHIEITEITMKFYFHTVKKYQYRYGHFDLNDIGKTIFLTKEEAEEKLKELEENGNRLT